MSVWKKSTTVGKPNTARVIKAKAWWNPKDESIKPRITSKTVVTVAPSIPDPTRTNTWPVY